MRQIVGQNRIINSSLWGCYLYQNDYGNVYNYNVVSALGKNSCRHLGINMGIYVLSFPNPLHKLYNISHFMKYQSTSIVYHQSDQRKRHVPIHIFLWYRTSKVSQLYIIMSA